MCSPKPPTAKTVYHVEASVSVKLLGSDYDGKILIDVDPGHLRQEDVIILALQALVNDIVEWYMPAPGLPLPPGVVTQHQPQPE